MINKKRLIRVAQGLEPADLVLKNGEVFIAFTGEFITADVAIAEGCVAGVGSYFGIQERDMSGRFLIPGFIDGHMHIESSMLSPYQYSRAALPCGVTTLIADPHEIANVFGAKGIQYMLDATDDLLLNIYFTLPSCVPATDLDASGAVLEAEDLAQFIDHPRVVGLAEMMNANGVLQQEKSVVDKIELARKSGYTVDGHAPGLSGSQIMGYAAAGINSDHECITKEHALARLRAGMFLMLREGSAAKNLKSLLAVVNQDTAPFCIMCTDDLIPGDLISKSYINNMVKTAIKEGIGVSTALQMATVNAARYFNLHDVGAIAPGYKADIQVYDDLYNWEPSAVFKDGKQVYEAGKDVIGGKKVDSSAMMSSVNIGDVSLETFSMPIKGQLANVIGLIPYQIITKKLKLNVKVEDGKVVSDTEKDILKMMVFERHHKTGKVGKGLVKGYGLKRGAVASTVSHDSHNLIVVGTNDEDMLLAVQELQRIGGGICITVDGKVIGSLPLPIAGLMTDEPAEDVAYQHRSLIYKARELGVPEYCAPFMTLAFLSLAVIPSLKLTASGLVDSEVVKVIPIEAKY